MRGTIRTLLEVQSISRACARLVGLLCGAALLAALPGAAASAATIAFSGSVDGSDYGGPLVFTSPLGPTPVYSYNSLDNGVATATAISGFSALSAVMPSDLTIRFGDLERLSTTFAPGGCTPIPPPGFVNCDAAIQTLGEGDLGPNFFEIDLAGTGTILSGQFLSATSVLDTDFASPGFGTQTSHATVQFTGGLSPYLDEVLALTAGTGIADLTGSFSAPLCTLGAEPCSFNTTAIISFVPEASMVLLLALGLAVLAPARWHRGQAQTPSPQTLR